MKLKKILIAYDCVRKIHKDDENSRDFGVVSRVTAHYCYRFSLVQMIT